MLVVKPHCGVFRQHEPRFRLEYLCYARAVVRSTPVSLTQAHLAEIAQLGVPVPGYDRGRLAPRIVHVGVGGFHRAHLAVYAHELAAAGGDWGIAGLGLLDAGRARWAPRCARRTTSTR